MTLYSWTDGCGDVELTISQLAVDEICAGNNKSLAIDRWQHLANDVPMDTLLALHKDIMGYESHPENVRQWLIHHAAWDCFDNPSYYKATNNGEPNYYKRGAIS